MLTYKSFTYGKKKATCFLMCLFVVRMGFPGGSDDKESACNVGDQDSICGLRRSSAEGNGYPLCVLAWRIPWTEEPGGHSE